MGFPLLWTALMAGTAMQTSVKYYSFNYFHHQNVCTHLYSGALDVGLPVMPTGWRALPQVDARGYSAALTTFLPLPSLPRSLLLLSIDSLFLFNFELFMARRNLKSNFCRALLPP